MAINDVYQIRMGTESFSGKTSWNVFYYKQLTEGAGGALDIYDAFYSLIIDAYQEFLDDGLSVEHVNIINGNNNEDQTEQLIDAVGIETTAAMPPFVAAGFRTQRPGIGYQYGYKRFGGVTARLEGAGEWNTAMSTDLNAMGIALGSVLEGNDGAYSPCILRGGFQLGIAPVVAYLADAPWLYNDQPTHQDTRQYYNWQVSTP